MINTSKKLNYLFIGQNFHLGDFPGGLVVKNLPCNAADLDSSLVRETKIPRATEQLNPCNHWGHALQLESPYAATKYPAQCNEDPGCRNWPNAAK